MDFFHVASNIDLSIVNGNAGTLPVSPTAPAPPTIFATSIQSSHRHSDTSAAVGGAAAEAGTNDPAPKPI